MTIRRFMLPAAFLLTVLLGRLDRDAESFADLIRWENLPALVIYTALFWLVQRGFHRLFARERRA